MAIRRPLPYPLTLLAAGACLALPGTATPCGPMYYAAAPVLAAFPERHSVKSMLDLFAEQQAAKAEPTKVDAFTLATAYLAATKEDGLCMIDEALERNRTSSTYEARMANLLWDLRDLRVATEGEFNEESRKYVEWRLNRNAGEQRGLPPGVAVENRQVEGGWWMTPEKLEEAKKQQAEKQAAIKVEQEEAQKMVAQASPAIAPHLMVVFGGAAFRRGALEEAESWFEKVVQGSPNHPRHETALYMLARTKLETERRSARKKAEAAPKDRGTNVLEFVEPQFEAYRKQYPQGRYLPEVAGWLGAGHSLSGRPWMALACYAEQLNLAKHPEVQASAGREVERCLKELLQSDAPAEPADIQNALVQLADSPAATTRLMGFFLDGPTNFGYEAHFSDDGLNDPVQLERINKMLSRSRQAKLLQRLAEAAIAHEDKFGTVNWHPKFVALMAWAATESGEHAQALRLCERRPEQLAQSDDLQYCRAVTLQRLGEDAEAVKAMEALAAKFPRSRLAQDLAMRMAQCLHRLKRDGEAIVALNLAVHRIQEEDKLPRPEFELTGLGHPSRNSSLNPQTELLQYLDVLEQFCPTAELEKALVSDHLPPKVRTRLFRLQIHRTLAAEDWEALRRTLAAAPPGWSEREEDLYSERAWQYGKWGQPGAEEAPIAVSLADRARAFLSTHEPAREPANAEAKALWYWSLAHLWEECRGELSLLGTCSSAGDYMASDHRQLELRLRANALALGYALKDINAELDARDELQHTYQYCLRAADAAPGTPVAARALHKAIECLRKMSEVSPYAQARAFEADWGGLSRQLHARLLKECPTSLEATQRAAWWTFAAPPELNGWMPGNGYASYEDHHVQWSMIAGDRRRYRERWGYPDWEKESARQRQMGALQKRIQQLGDVVTTQGIEAARTEAASIRQTLVPFADLNGWTPVMSGLDEAELVLSQPLDQAERIKRYFLNPTEDAATEPFPGLKAYHDRGALRDDERGGDDWWSLQEEFWRNYLETYPTSIKREAAQFQLARAIVRQHRTWTHVRNHSWPVAPFIGRYVRLVVEREKPFDAARVHAALDVYEKEFPKGRYLADIRLLRGDVAVDAGDYRTALQLLSATLADETHQELHLDAALSLAQCFELLHDPEKRLAVAKAIASHEVAWGQFTTFTHSPTCGQRLRVYEEWIAQMRPGP